MKQKGKSQASLADRFGIPSAAASDDRGICLTTINPKLLAAAISGIVAAGDAAVIGSTRDGGAVVITVLSGTDKHKFYAANQGELEDNLNLIRRGYGIDPIRTDVPDDKVG